MISDDKNEVLISTNNPFSSSWSSANVMITILLCKVIPTKMVVCNVGRWPK